MDTPVRYEASGELSTLIDRRRGVVTADELATTVRAWRGRMRLGDVASMLGLPPTTLKGIEQGRGFRYPHLLLLAMRDLKPNGRWRG